MSGDAAADGSAGGAAVELREVGYAYPDGTPGLRGVTLSVRPGERVALLGPNGAGKSTLLLCLNGILRATGEVRVGGLLLGPRTLREVRARVGLVFQDPEDQLFAPTLGEDVAFGPRNFGRRGPELAAAVREALAAVGLAGFEPRSPHHLSFGEKKRAALATVLAFRPAILALDEPSANLDARGQALLVGQLGGLAATLLVATQDTCFAAQTCARGVILDGGRVVADAPLETLLADAALLERHGLEFGRRCRFCRR